MDNFKKLSTVISTTGRNLLILLLFMAINSIAYSDDEKFINDDVGNSFRTDKPARRIISLAPHITELLYSAGAGQYIVGTVSYSDYPAAAKKIKRIGSYNKFSIEEIIALKPDLIVAWDSGNPHHIVGKLKSLGYPVFINRPRHLKDLPSIVKRLSLLTHTNADKPIADYLKKYNDLKKRYANKRKVKLFYQYWNNPLMTINGQHIISDVMRLCGAENIFEKVKVLAPAVSVESVVQSDVEIIIVGGLQKQHRQWLDDWRKWKDLPAVKNKHLYNVNPDLLQRHTLRIIDGAKLICEKTDLVRHR